MPLRKQKSRRRIYSKESVVQTTELYLLDSVPTSSTTLDTFLKFFFSASVLSIKCEFL